MSVTPPSGPAEPAAIPPRTVISAVFFESREAYERLANDPRQDEFWRTRFLPLLEGGPQWFDGTWQTALIQRAVRRSSPTR